MRYDLEILASALGATLLAPGCLPADNRPTPGSVYVATEAGPAVADGITTSDGWTVSFERVLVGLGTVELHGGGCKAYAQAFYTRLFDFAVPSDRQKVSIVYGLGTCSVDFRVRTPHVDAVLGPGVTADDLELLRVEKDDAWVAEPESASVRVVGQAVRDGTTKRFEWMFRKRYHYEGCPFDAGGGNRTLDIDGEDAEEVTVVLDAAELFRARDADDAPFVFDPYADADADADGEITLDELADVDAAATVDPEAPPGEAAVAPGVSLAELVYFTLVPRMARFAGGGACDVDIGQGWR